MKYPLSTIILLFVTTSNFAQYRATVIHGVQETNTFRGRVNWLSEPLPKEWFQSIPDSIREAQVYHGSGSYLQFAVNKLSKGIMDTAEYQKEFDYWKENYSLSNYPATLDFVPSELFFVVGYSIRGDTILGLDPTMDYDFSDGVFWQKPSSLLSREKQIQFSPSISRKSSFWHNDKLYTGINVVKAGIKEFGNSNRWYGMVSPAFIPFFEIDVKGTKYHLEWDNGTEINFKTNWSRIYRTDLGPMGKMDYWTIGDTIMIDGTPVVFTDVDVLGNWVDYEVLEGLSELVAPVRGGIAPEIFALTLDDSIFKLSNYRGKYVFLDFWATWCGPCVMAVPDIKRAYEAVGNQIEFVGLASDESENVNRFVKEYDIKWTQILLSGEQEIIANRYKVDGFPKYFLIDPEGKIINVDAELFSEPLNYFREILAK